MLGSLASDLVGAQESLPDVVRMRHSDRTLRIVRSTDLVHLHISLPAHVSALISFPEIGATAEISLDFPATQPRVT